LLRVIVKGCGISGLDGQIPCRRGLLTAPSTTASGASTTTGRGWVDSQDPLSHIVSRIASLPAATGIEAVTPTGDMATRDGELTNVPAGGSGGLSLGSGPNT
jgi:hypothetical protein